MTPFRWQRDRLVADLDSHEAALLRQLINEIRDALSAIDRDSAADPAPALTQVDPVVERLLPAGHRGDPELAEDFRELTEAGLRREKLADAELVLGSISQDGGRVEVNLDGAESWLRTLNDVRLGIGVGLDVQENDDPMIRVEETGDPRWAVYSWLTAVQGLLVDVLSGG